ncbi:E3 ubiquitin-protein ligase RNF138 [Platysternon megacephalum]|uniref:E3 ubiquitin-protein ligase RNF138 n=1 Tax=Platysternon megacephalum TaxID=55544 RepID=A0A4D9DVZ6_9SAUR|nr:E3 ubiquitin-protein ligase RNF138 [Platysternon megacephalum]
MSLFRATGFPKVAIDGLMDVTSPPENVLKRLGKNIIMSNFGMTSVAQQDPQKKSKQKSGSVSEIIIAGEGISSSPKAEKNLTLQQEKSQTVQPVAARKGTQPSLKRELSSLWVQEKFQAVKKAKILSLFS